MKKIIALHGVSKISMFMHGADNGNVIFGDGLDNHNEKIVVENGQFDILVANPPYSVSAFKNHLELKNNKPPVKAEIAKDNVTAIFENDDLNSPFDLIVSIKKVRS